MAGLVYFFAGPGSTSKQSLVKRFPSLADKFESGGPSVCQVSRGPEGQSGVAFALPSPAGVAGRPNRVGDLRWSKTPNSDLWVGYEPASPPVPRDLQRGKLIHGHDVKLADGQDYTIPVARKLDGEPGLPRKLEHDGQRWSPGGVLPVHEDLWSGALKVWAFLEEAEAFVLDDAYDLAAMALGANYMVGAPEICALGLLDTESAAEVVRALVDWPLVEQWLKAGKGSPEGEASSSGHGQGALSVTTAQPLQSST